VDGCTHPAIADMAKRIEPSIFSAAIRQPASDGRHDTQAPRLGVGELACHQEADRAQRIRVNVHPVAAAATVQGLPGL
jgi:hypothetical protein